MDNNFAEFLTTGGWNTPTHFLERRLILSVVKVFAPVTPIVCTRTAPTKLKMQKARGALAPAAPVVPASLVETHCGVLGLGKRTLENSLYNINFAPLSNYIYASTVCCKTLEKFLSNNLGHLNNSIYINFCLDNLYILTCNYLIRLVFVAYYRQLKHF